MKKTPFFFLSLMAMSCLAMESDKGVGFVLPNYVGSPSPEPCSDDYLIYVKNSYMAHLIRESAEYSKGCEAWIKEVNELQGLQGPSEDAFNLCRAFARLRGNGSLRVHKYYKVVGAYVRVKLEKPQPITCTHEIEAFEDVEEVKSAYVALFIAHARELQSRMEAE